MKQFRVRRQRSKRKFESKILTVHESRSRLPQIITERALRLLDSNNIFFTSRNSSSSRRCAPRWSSRNHSRISTGHVSIHSRLRAVPNDMPRFTAFVACFSRCVERATVRSGAITRDVAEFAARVTLHCLCLAISSEMVRPTALVAHRWSTGANECGSHPADESASWCWAWASTTHSWHTWCGTIALWIGISKIDLGGALVPSYCQVTWSTAGVAVSSTCSTETQCWAVGLYMAYSLTVVTLFCYCNCVS